jgi:hypothetical protein
MVFSILKIAHQESGATAIDSGLIAGQNQAQPAPMGPTKEAIKFQAFDLDRRNIAPTCFAGAPYGGCPTSMTPPDHCSPAPEPKLGRVTER